MHIAFEPCAAYTIESVTRASADQNTVHTKVTETTVLSLGKTLVPRRGKSMNSGPTRNAVDGTCGRKPRCTSPILFIEMRHEINAVKNASKGSDCAMEVGAPE